MDAREFAWESQLRFYWDRGLVSGMGVEGTAVGGRGLAVGVFDRQGEPAAFQWVRGLVIDLVLQD